MYCDEVLERLGVCRCWLKWEPFGRPNGRYSQEIVEKSYLPVRVREGNGIQTCDAPGRGRGRTLGVIVEYTSLLEKCVMIETPVLT